MKLPYQIELIPISKENGGGYLASIPLLHGCKSDGKTPDEAVKNLGSSRTRVGHFISPRACK
jgi:hypothetical protein